MIKQENRTLPFSYHTFIFPFIWNNNGTVSREQFEKCIHPHWILDERQDTPFDRELYAQYCYFNEAARNVIFTEKDNPNATVRNFRFDFGAFNGDEQWLHGKKTKENNVRYVIRKGEFVASLSVNGIRLRLFGTGVGMIVFELENYQYNDEKSINIINELGRRIFMPFIADDGHCPLCADEIALEYPNGKITSVISGAELKRNSDIRFAELIMFLLRRGEYSATTNPNPGETQFFIEPIIDDRMFVACVWNNANYVETLKQDVDGQYRYLADSLQKEPDGENNAAGRLYELVFIDGTGLSCQSKPMLHQMLTDHIYSRWIEYGTITGVSEYSLVTVTGFPPNITAFLTEYIEMVMLVLVQRASLLAFERQIGDCARGKLRVAEIQQAYVHFQSEYLLREVTPQQQGIELYNMLLQNLYIDEARADVEKEISALFALQRDTSDRKDNKLLFILAAFGVFDIVNFFIVQLSQQNWNVLIPAALVFAGIIYWFIRNHSKV